MLTSNQIKSYENLSPFELKSKLISMANHRHERMMLNAGRGNPNWIATIPREAFFQLGFFAIEESKRIFDTDVYGGSPEKLGIAKRFGDFVKRNEAQDGVQFLCEVFNYARSIVKATPDEFVYEMVDGILGDHYPEPPRMLPCSEKIVRKYIEQEMFAGISTNGKLDLFATEGGTAAMDYVFNCLMENKLLNKGDKIALGVPLFTPYIEIPNLSDFNLIKLEVKQDKDKNYQYPNSEIDKLKDPNIKAFFIINPSNPASVKISNETLERIAKLVNETRKDLIILTDDVYATFVDDFRSLISVAPRNTILVYSYSKYFGATGWRLGVVGIHRDNIFDKMVAELPKNDKEELSERYKSVVLNPPKMKFIDRMVADSRLVALHHTAGLSTPQQIQMVLFSLYCLIDKDNSYKQGMRSIVDRRFKILYKAIGVPVPENKCDTHYYTTIDIIKLAEHRYGKQFSEFLTKQFKPIDFVMRLASEKGVVLIDGGGFYAPSMSVRVSLANLFAPMYEKIGKSISELLADYHRYWQMSLSVVGDND